MVIFIISIVITILGFTIYTKKMYKLGYMFFYYKSIDKSYKIKNEKDKEEIAEITGTYMIIIGLIMGMIYLLSMVLDIRILILVALIIIPGFYYKLYKSLNICKGEKIEEPQDF